jgi:ABC-type transport system involved in multi-copper enzyme maturation permease subunit
MTATTITVPRTPRAARRRPVPWTRLAWVTLRQHRPALIGAAAFLGLVSLYLLIMGLQINHAYAQVAACHPAGSAACQQLAQAFNQQYWGGGGGGALSAGGAQTVSSLLLVVPVMLGIFLGAPVLAREFETGTFRFAWTQGCGRARWAVSKLVLLAVIVTAVTWAFTELFTWYYHAFLVDGQVSRLLPLAFGLLGVAFAAWTLAAFAIAAFFGALIRRTVPAMAATLVTWTVLAIGTATWLRQHYLAPLKTTALNPPAGAWVLGNYSTGPNGQVLSQRAFNQLAQQAPASVQNSPNRSALQDWLAQQHYTQWTSYEPASRFWHFQLIEAGWLVALSAILIAASVWLVRRRAA